MKTIKLTQGKKAIVDDEHFAWLSKSNWYFDAGYAVRNGRMSDGHGRVRMHREIARRVFGFVLNEVDHINGNGLDNRSCNLRLCVHRQNAKNTRKRKDNTTGFKGVTFNKRDGKYQAKIMKDGKEWSCGYFKTADEAHKAYIMYAKKLHGEFANAG